MASSVKIDQAGLAKVMSGSGVRAYVHSNAEDVAARARGLAPMVSGAYVNSIHVVDTTSPQGWARAHVLASAPHAAVVESRHGVLAAAIAGLPGPISSGGA